MKNCNRDVPIINVDDRLCKTIRHVNKAFYRTDNGKIDMVLKEIGLKDVYSQEINFKGKLVIQTIFSESFHYLLVKELNAGEEISQMLFSKQCSYPQLLQTPLSKSFF